MERRATKTQSFILIEYPQTANVGAYRIRPDAPTYPRGRFRAYAIRPYSQSPCHAGFAIRRNPLFGFVIRIIHVGVADYKSARVVYGGLQIRRDKRD